MHIYIYIEYIIAAGRLFHVHRQARLLRGLTQDQSPLRATAKGAADEVSAGFEGIV